MNIGTVGAVTVFDASGNVVLSASARSASYEQTPGPASFLRVEAETSSDQRDALLEHAGQQLYITTKMHTAAGSHVYAMHDAALQAVDPIDTATSRLSFTGIGRRISD